jgi:protein SCO1/2
MPAMTMSFRTGENIAGLQPGMRVRFRFDGRLARRIQKVPPVEAGMPRADRSLEVGDRAPDFELIDQAGNAVRFSHLNDKPVLLNFLYTRCPVPEVCPRLAAAFAFIHRRFGESVRLVSITVDPVWDTPPVLDAYAKLWRARPGSWHFLTGSPDAVARVGRDYGLVYWPDEGVVAHTARTWVIARNGLIAAVLEGTSWRPEQLASLVERQLETPQ